MIPGEYILKQEGIIANIGRQTINVYVTNTGDRPVQIGSHFHFFEVNKLLCFEREKSFGMRLNIPAGNAIRFEPGEEKEVQLVCFSGNNEIHGFNNLLDGTINEDNKKVAMEKAASQKFKNPQS